MYVRCWTETETGSLILVFCVHICISNWWFNNIITDWNGNHAPQHTRTVAALVVKLIILMTWTKKREKKMHTHIQNFENNAVLKIIIYEHIISAPMHSDRSASTQASHTLVWLFFTRINLMVVASAWCGPSLKWLFDEMPETREKCACRKTKTWL